MTQQEWYQKIASITPDEQLENYFHDIVTGLSFFDINVFEAQVGTATLNEWPLVAFKTFTDHSAQEQQSEQYVRRLDEKKYHDDAERAQLQEKSDQIYWNIVAETQPARQRVLDLLEEFYRPRTIQYGVELITSDYGFAYGMIRNANSQGFAQLDDDPRRLRYLEACRQEFLDFGAFLKQKVLDK